MTPSGVFLLTTLCFAGAPRSTAADEIIVFTPSTSLEVGRSFSLSWDYATDSDVSGTTGDLNPFEIELRSCNGEGSCEKNCGDFHSSLCGNDWGCLDSDGSYDVVIPTHTGAGDYVVRVVYLEVSGWSSAGSSSRSGSSTSSSSISSAGDLSACSGVFPIEEATGAVRAAMEGMPWLAATAPPSSMSPGDAFTARWEYNDGDGNRGGGTFDIDLFTCADDACSGGRCVSATVCITYRS